MGETAFQKQLKSKNVVAPLDVAVLATLKSKIRKLISELVEEDDNGYFNISKDDAIQVSCLAWKGAKVGRNVSRGFKACGLYPLSLVKMGARLENFSRNGAPRHVQLATWLQMRAVVEGEILKLPAAPRKNDDKKRERVSVGGRLLTHEVLQQVQASSAAHFTKKRRQPNPAPSTTDCATEIIEFVLV
ncbi:hypothetical protein PInf_030144 [Phytophthora infestans]|nr:hypothetical protein PInf_030144 [Phytophthora infestans]